MAMLEFEWDPIKEKQNIHKHKISFIDAIHVFFDDNGFELEEAKHSDKEKRKYWVGKAKNGKVITVRYTRRKGKIRIIGAAEWREFRGLYNEKTKNK
jgi:uncharacterized protein